MRKVEGETRGKGLGIRAAILKRVVKPVLASRNSVVLMALSFAASTGTSVKFLFSVSKKVGMMGVFKCVVCLFADLVSLNGDR